MSSLCFIIINYNYQSFDKLILSITVPKTDLLRLKDKFAQFYILGLSAQCIQASVT